MPVPRAPLPPPPPIESETMPKMPTTGRLLPGQVLALCLLTSCASFGKVNVAPEPPRIEAVAPVKMIVPRLREGTGNSFSRSARV